MIEVFDNSMLSLYKQCPQKFHYRMVLHLIPKVEEGSAKQWGSALHSALARWYSGEGQQAAIDTFITEFTPHNGKEEKRSLGRGVIILTQYFEKYKEEPFTIKHVEVGFSAELGEYIICGKMDGMVNWTLGFNGLVVLEHKFSASKGYLIVDPNQQLDTYIWGVKQLTQENVIGAYFNLVYHTKKDPEDVEFSRTLTYRTAEQIVKWEEDTIGWCNAVNESVKKGKWGRNSNNCGAYWRSCEYIHLCRAKTPSEQEALIEAVYNKDIWNPYPDSRNYESEANNG